MIQIFLEASLLFLRKMEHSGPILLRNIESSDVVAEKNELQRKYPNTA